MLVCLICRKRRIAEDDTVCRTCRRFIIEYVDTKVIRPRPVPMVADVRLVMQRLGVSAEIAVIALGGMP